MDYFLNDLIKIISFMYRKAFSAPFYFGHSPTLNEYFWIFRKNFCKVKFIVNPKTETEYRYLTSRVGASQKSLQQSFESP